MRPRQKLLELFSTFIQFTEERFNRWLIDPKLLRQMESCLKQELDADTSENFWVLYWYKNWQNEPASLAIAHLSAYLQEPCYWAAQQTANRFASLQYKLSDCFQIAITQVNTVLKSFNPKYSYNLKSYAKVTFKSILTNMLRQTWEADCCTDWALLRKVSQKRLETALSLAGLSSEDVVRYRLAWVCFNTLYVSNQATRTQQLSRPESATWEAIAKLYNSERHNLNFSSPSATATTIEQWLKQCAKRVRSYLYPQTTSLNAPQANQEVGEWIDNLPSPDESLLTEMIVQEETKHRQTQQTEINSILATALSQLDSEIQTILQLYYGENLTQQQLAQQLETKQYTISRRLTKGRESLLKALMLWSQNTLQVSLSSEVIQQINAVLDEWLQNFYQSA